MNGNEREKRGKHAFISFTCAFLFFIVFCLFFFLIKITHSVPFICILIRKKTKKRHNQELQLGEDTEGRVVSERVKKKERRALVPHLPFHSSSFFTTAHQELQLVLDITVIPPHNPSISRYLLGLCSVCSFVLFWLIYNGN